MGQATQKHKDAPKIEPPSNGAKFVPLHCHSWFSLLDGLCSPSDIASTAFCLGHKAVAVTDHGSCAGLYKLQEKCKKLDVKPIFGMETYFAEDVSVRNKDEKPSHLTIWAKNAIGYKNLIALSTRAYTEGFYSKPRIDFGMLSKHREGLMIGSACAKGIVCKRVIDGDESGARVIAGKMKELFGGDFYCEIMGHIYNPEAKDKEKKFLDAMRVVLKIADDMGIKSIFTYDSHYCKKEEAFYQDVLMSMQTGDTIKNPNRMSLQSSDFYMKSFEELERICRNRPDLLSNTLEVAEKVEPNLLVPVKESLPDFPLPPGIQSEEQYFKKLVRDGMMKRGIFNDQTYRDRISTELDVITKCGFVRYFLLLWDLVDFARRNNISMGPGRGSGAASLCLYCLDVTQLDPIKHDLMFARFLNPDRVSPPDVDLDFDDTKQSEMFKYVSMKYGQSCVTRIGTYGSMKVKDAIRRVGKALDIGGDWEEAAKSGKGDQKGKWKSGKNTLQLVGSITKAVKSRELDMSSPEKLLKSFENHISKSSELGMYASDYPQLFEVCKKMITGCLTSCGVHPAGIILCRFPVSDLVPLRVTKEVLCTQFDMKEVEPMGLLKFDFLGLRTVRVMKRCLDLVEARTGEHPDIDALEPNDQKVFDLLNKQSLAGVFQFDGSDGIGELLRNIHVDSFNDMVVTCALYRPGTLKGKMPSGKNVPEAYCIYKKDPSKVKYIHPMMKDFLSETYGMMVYQEQVMLASVKMAGFNPVEADTFRKAIGKKQGDLFLKLKEKFMSGCIQSGVGEDVGKKVFALCEFFSGYGFNKAHSASYAYLAYQTAWLKAYYPIEFMCSLLSSVVDKEDERIHYERACEAMGIELDKHHINKSKTDYTIVGSHIQKPLTSLKGIGEASVVKIVDAQPFENLEDFLRKVDGHAANKKAFETLAMSGCMNCFGMTSKAMIASYEEIRAIVKKKEAYVKRERKAGFGEKNLFDLDV